MRLNTRGIISLVQIAVYVPTLCVAILLVVRHGFSRKLGWIFLAIFSISNTFNLFTRSMQS